MDAHLFLLLLKHKDATEVPTMSSCWAAFCQRWGNVFMWISVRCPYIRYLRKKQHTLKNKSGCESSVFMSGKLLFKNYPFEIFFYTSRLNLPFFFFSHLKTKFWQQGLFETGLQQNQLVRPEMQQQAISSFGKFNCQAFFFLKTS